jgi:cell division septation protein DedD
MHPVDHYLKELLFEHDCVTVPGLGGFIAQSRPSRLLRDRRRIYPPSRIVGFNAMLLHDDGNLASCVAREEQVSYREAVARVEEFTNLCKKSLRDRGNMTFEGIGSISMGPEGNLVFQPLPDMNFSASSYGLESIFVHPAHAERPKERLAEKHTDRTQAHRSRTTPNSVRWTLGVTIPVILFLLYGIIFPTSIQRLYTNYSGIFTGIDINSPGQELTPGNISKPLPGSEQPVVLPVDPAHAPETDLAAGPAPIEETAPPEPLPLNVKPDPTPKAEPEPIQHYSPIIIDKSLAQGQKYFIIGGCFEAPENARKFLNELRQRGFEAEEAGVNRNGFFRISYKSFLNRQEAVAYLNAIKGRENPSAWLLKY